MENFGRKKPNPDSIHAGWRDGHRRGACPGMGWKGSGKRVGQRDHLAQTASGSSRLDWTVLRAAVSMVRAEESTTTRAGMPRTP